jgi:hypothetical protein
MKARVSIGNRKFACCLLHADFFLGIYFDPEDGGDIFLRKVF